MVLTPFTINGAEMFLLDEGDLAPAAAARSPIHATRPLRGKRARRSARVVSLSSMRKTRMPPFFYRGYHCSFQSSGTSAGGFLQGGSTNASWNH